VAGARPRTLGAGIAPVLVGTAAATLDGPVVGWRVGAALVVALAFQVGVNYANDYSDGVRGTDAVRAGPVRLTASGLASPHAVKRAAIASFATGATVGAVLALVVDSRLLVVGAVALVAGATYSGGPRPYASAGLGELMVLVFFGGVATTGSAYVQHETVPAAAWWGALAVGLVACGIMLANNIRDVPTDRDAGKRTLAVRVGAARARRLYVACLAGAYVAVAIVTVLHPWAALAFVSAPLAWRPARLVVTGRAPPQLVAALVGTARLEVVLAALLAVGLVVA